MLGFLPTRAYRPGTPGATTFLSPLSGTFNYGWDSFNRQHEPWVLDGLSYLNHPLRADHARQFIEPALELLEEVQRTGGIFFPGAWIQATLSGHTHPEAAETVRSFLDARTDYPAPLRGKILQASDMVGRSASIVYGWSG